MKVLINGDRKMPTKLGDCLFMFSIFCFYKKVYWEVHTQHRSPTWNQLEPMYTGRYNLRMDTTVSGLFENFRNVLYRCAKEGLVIAEPEYSWELDVSVPEKYVTFQSQAVDRTRSFQNDPTEFADGYPVIDLDSFPRDSLSVHRIFELQRGAQFHIGPDSGSLWTALAVSCPVKLSLNNNIQSQKQHEQRRAVTTLVDNHDNVEYI